MACTQQDMDLLDKAKMHPQLHFLDAEIQRLIKNISLFGFEEESPAPVAAPSEPSKASLFQVKAAPKVREEPKKERPPSPPPAIPDEPLEDELSSHHENDENAFDLDQLKIGSDDDNDNNIDDTLVEEEVGKADNAPASQATQEDEDELDLS